MNQNERIRSLCHTNSIGTFAGIRKCQRTSTNGVRHIASVFKMSSDKLSAVENKLKKHLHSDLFKIIVECGFNTKSAILLISSEIIKDIETYVNENKEILKETIYEPYILNGKVFKLKPGHKSIILNLPKLLRPKTQTSKPEKKTKVQKEKNIGNVDFESRESSDKNEQELKCAIIKKIENFSLKFDLDLSIDIAHISDFHTESDKTVCKFQCPLCPVKIKCEYRSYWLVSNLEKHLKGHYRFETSYLSEESAELDLDTEIVSHGLNQFDDIQKILDD